MDCTIVPCNKESMANLDGVDMDDVGCCNLPDEMLSSLVMSSLDYDPLSDHGVPRPLKPSLDDKLQRTLQIFKQSSGDGAGSMLAQVWVPMRCGNQQVLSTRGHPFLHDQALSGYREVSRLFTFDAELGVGSFPDLPGRVFISKVPEWTSNVIHYSKEEFLRLHHAIDHEVRGSMALPVFDEDDYCCAVLELVTKEEKLNFDEEVESVCRALQAVDLSSTPPHRLRPQSLLGHQKDTLAEIKEILNVICHAYQLPLALTWIPCTYTENRDTVQVNVRRQNILGPDKKSIMCIRGSACYWKDTHMHRFVHACAGHFLEEEQGIVGKAFLSNQPIFSSDVRGYHISEYPLVHHARKVGLNAGIAIRVRNAGGDENDYVLELFLPVNIKDGTEQQLLLRNLYDSVLRLCVSLRQVSDEELDWEKSYKHCLLENSRSLPRANCPREAESSSRLPKNKKKLIEYSVIESYFRGSIKDAAKSLGVSIHTLQRMCREHGISRWPSRKISQANRSLNKIRGVLGPIVEIEWGLQYNLTIGGPAAGKSFSFFNPNHSSNVRSSEEWPWLD